MNENLLTIILVESGRANLLVRQCIFLERLPESQLTRRSTKGVGGRYSGTSERMGKCLGWMRRRRCNSGRRQGGALVASKLKLRGAIKLPTKTNYVP